MRSRDKANRVKEKKGPESSAAARAEAKAGDKEAKKAEHVQAWAEGEGQERGRPWPQRKLTNIDLEGVLPHADSNAPGSFGETLDQYLSPVGSKAWHERAMEELEAKKHRERLGSWEGTGHATRSGLDYREDPNSTWNKLYRNIEAGEPDPDERLDSRLRLARSLQEGAAARGEEADEYVKATGSELEGMASEVEKQNEVELDGEDDLPDPAAVFSDVAGFQYKVLPEGGYEIVSAPEGSGVQSGLKVTDPSSTAFQSIDALAKERLPRPVGSKSWHDAAMERLKAHRSALPARNALGAMPTDKLAKWAVNAPTESDYRDVGSKSWHDDAMGKLEAQQAGEASPDPMGRQKAMEIALRKNDILGKLETTDQRLLVKERLAGKSGPELSAALDALEAFLRGDPPPQTT